MTFKLEVLDTADSANIQGMDPIARAQFNIADTLEEQIPRDGILEH